MFFAQNRGRNAGGEAGLVVYVHLDEFVAEDSCRQPVCSGDQDGGADFDIPLTRNAGADRGTICHNEVQDCRE